MIPTIPVATYMIDDNDGNCKVVEVYKDSMGGFLLTDGTTQTRLKIDKTPTYEEAAYLFVEEDPSSILAEEVSASMQSPGNLSKAELVQVVSRIQEILYGDQEEDELAGSQDRSWSPDTLQEIALVLQDAGLSPDEDSEARKQ